MLNSRRHAHQIIFSCNLTPAARLRQPRQQPQPLPLPLMILAKSAKILQSWKSKYSSFSSLLALSVFSLLSLMMCTKFLEKTKFESKKKRERKRIKLNRNAATTTTTFDCLFKQWCNFKAGKTKHTHTHTKERNGKVSFLCCMHSVFMSLLCFARFKICSKTRSTKNDDYYRLSISSSSSSSVEATLALDSQPQEEKILYYLRAAKDIALKKYIWMAPRETKPAL